MFSAEWNKSKHRINQRSSLIIHMQDYLPCSRDKYKCGELKRMTVVKPFWLRALAFSCVPAHGKVWLWQRDMGCVESQRHQHQPAGHGWGPKHTAAPPRRHSEWSKSNYYFPHFEITQRGSSILLQIEFHKPSKQFCSSLRNRLSGSSLSDGVGGGRWLLSLISAACWSQHKSPITIQNTITFLPLHERRKSPVCLKITTAA